MSTSKNKLPKVVRESPTMDQSTLRFAHLKGALVKVEDALTDSYLEPTVTSISYAVGCIEKFNILATEYIEGQNISITRRQIEYSMNKDE